MGRPKLPDAEKNIPHTFTLTPEAVAALHKLAPPPHVNRSKLVSDLLIEAAKKKRPPK